MESPKNTVTFTITLAHGLIILALLAGFGAGVGVDRFLLNSNPSRGDASRLGPQDEIGQLSPIQIPIDGRAYLGPADAPVTIVEFTDYQCPYCKRFYDQTFPALKETYIDQGNVLLVSRDYPLGFHERAKPAAVATKCADKQQAYWPMRKRLADNIGNLSSQLFESIATELSLDGDAFRQCISNPVVLCEVERDILQANDLGVTGTPTFFIGRIENGRLL